MYLQLASILLFGMIPVQGTPSEPIGLQGLPIAPPALTAENGIVALAQAASAEGVAVADLESGQMLYGRGLEDARPMASLTKLMTAILIAESMDLDDVIRVPDDIDSVEGQAILQAGQHYRVGDLLTAMLVHSANDAAVTLARAHSGSEEAFVQEMNARAQDLGLKDTAFRNATGLDATGQYSTPQNLAWLASFALRKPALADRLAMKSATITSVEGDSASFTHTHLMVRQGSPVLLGKTGTTDAAKQCLFSVVQEGDRKYVVVLLGSDERYRDLQALLTVLRTLSA